MHDSFKKPWFCKLFQTDQCSHSKDHELAGKLHRHICAFYLSQGRILPHQKKSVTIKKRANSCSAPVSELGSMVNEVDIDKYTSSKSVYKSDVVERQSCVVNSDICHKASDQSGISEYSCSKSVHNFSETDKQSCFVKHVFVTILLILWVHTVVHSNCLLISIQTRFLPDIFTIIMLTRKQSRGSLLEVARLESGLWLTFAINTPQEFPPGVIMTGFESEACRVKNPSWGELVEHLLYQLVSTVQAYG